LEVDASLAAETNPDALRFLTAIPCLGEIPYIASDRFNRSSLAELFDRQVGGALQGLLTRR
jgi:hypothetical protein